MRKELQSDRAMRKETNCQQRQNRAMRTETNRLARPLINVSRKKERESPVVLSYGERGRVNWRKLCFELGQKFGSEIRMIS
jgi:hypothetical protein